jgi:hypothetical protein
MLHGAPIALFAGGQGGRCYALYALHVPHDVGENMPPGMALHHPTRQTIARLARPK